MTSIHTIGQNLKKCLNMGNPQFFFSSLGFSPFSPSFCPAIPRGNLTLMSPTLEGTHLFNISTRVVLVIRIQANGTQIRNIVPGIDLDKLCSLSIFSRLYKLLYPINKARYYLHECQTDFVKGSKHFQRKFQYCN